MTIKGDWWEKLMNLGFGHGQTNGQQWLLSISRDWKSYFVRPSSLPTATVQWRTRQVWNISESHCYPHSMMLSTTSGSSPTLMILDNQIICFRSGHGNLHLEKLLLLLPCLRHVDTIIRMFWAKIKQVRIQRLILLDQLLKVSTHRRMLRTSLFHSLYNH